MPKPSRTDRRILGSKAAKKFADIAPRPSPATKAEPRMVPARPGSLLHRLANETPEESELRSLARLFDGASQLLSEAADGDVRDPAAMQATAEAAATAAMTLRGMLRERQTIRVVAVVEGGILQDLLPITPGVKVEYEVLDWDETETHDETIELSPEALAVLSDDARRDIEKHNAACKGEPAQSEPTRKVPDGLLFFQSARTGEGHDDETLWIGAPSKEAALAFVKRIKRHGKGWSLDQLERTLLWGDGLDCNIDSSAKIIERATPTLPGVGRGA